MIFEKIKEILVDQLEVDPEKVTMDADLLNDLDADSLDVVDLVMSVEDEFDIEIPDEVLEGASTVGDVVRYLEKNVK